MNQLTQDVVMEMEMSVLSTLNVIEDENEYVFVRDDEMDFDDESYDHCDLSPDLSCAASVCSGVTLNDLIQENGIESSMVSVEEDRNDGESKEEGGKPDDGECTLNANLQNGRRVCNKKRRKKLKMMKKAAALEARKAQVETPPEPVREPERTSPERPSRNKSKSKRSVNLAVACAHESLAAYREEVASKQKKSLVNYVL